MNETANATLALGALPVMAHARRRSRRWPRLAVGARAQHRHALGRVGRGDAARRAGGERRGRPRRARPGRRRRDRATARRRRGGSLDELELAVVRGNAAEIATLAGARPRSAASSRSARASAAGARPRGGAGLGSSPRSPGRSTTSPTATRARGRQRPRAAGDRDRHRVHVDRDHRLLPRRPAGEPARGGGRGARGVRRRRRGCGSRGREARLVPRRALRRALRPGSGRRWTRGRRSSEAACRGRATSRRPGWPSKEARRSSSCGVKAPTDQIVEAGRGFRDLRATFVVNDDVDAALELGADGVHLGRGDAGAERARGAGLLLGASAASVAEARDAEGQGAGLHRRRPGLGDADEARRRPTDRPRRPARDLRGRSRFR